VDTEKLLKRALEVKVAFVPGFAFYPDGGGRNAMRLNFSCMPPDKIRVGIERLGNAIREEIASAQ
jgi:DNA-binding transcriptional MocR family regulator